MTKDEKIFKFLLGVFFVVRGILAFYDLSKTDWPDKLLGTFCWLLAAFCFRLCLRRESDTYKNPNKK